MTLHLIKLCVGIEKFEELAGWQQRRLGKEGELRHITRMTPRRGEELLDGGSIYWVIRGQIQARQRLLELRPVTDGEGAAHCALILDAKLVRTVPQPRRPFQGWRYLAAEDAPPDMGKGRNGGKGDMPDSMRAELMALGLL
ncbi:MAG: DUF1489 family protein [Pseudomonadota bacterium]|jgi:hypothetical protein|nr:DUF1489 domain-containing protein [Alphaproteobacteria bacterium]